MNSKVLWLVLYIILISSTTLFAQKSGKNKLKIAYLIKITQLIKWNSAAHPEENFVVAVVGKSDFNDWIIRGFTGREVNGKKVEIHEVFKLSDLSHFDLIYITNPEDEYLEEYLKEAQKQQALAVSTGRGFLNRGGHLSFFTSENKVRFEINHEAMEFAGVKAKALLLNYLKKMKEVK